MPTVSISLESQIFDRLEKYMKKNKLESKTDAIRDLLEKAGF